MKRFIICLLSIGIAIICVGCGKTVTEKEESEQKLRAIICEYLYPIVKEELKNPESAEFVDASQMIIRLEENRYYVLGGVYATNSYGCEILNGFETYISFQNEKITDASNILFLDGEVYKNKLDLENQKALRETSGERLLTESELIDEIRKQDLYVYSVDVVKKEDMFAAIGDMLQATLYNNSKREIYNAIVAFVGWDKSGLPIKLQSPVSFYDGVYVSTVSYNNINLSSGKTYGQDYGYYVDESLNVHTIKAIVVSFVDSEGIEWKNPYYLDFVELYEGEKLNK